jgi:hypothetical protein
MDNPETLAKLGTQDTGRRQNKAKNTTQKIKISSLWMVCVNVDILALSYLE